MKNFIITFGTGKEALNVQSAGADIMQVLAALKDAGWEVERVTKIEIIDSYKNTIKL